MAVRIEDIEFVVIIQFVAYWTTCGDVFGIRTADVSASINSTGALSLPSRCREHLRALVTVGSWSGSGIVVTAVRVTVGGTRFPAGRGEADQGEQYSNGHYVQ